MIPMHRKIAIKCLSIGDMMIMLSSFGIATILSNQGFEYIYFAQFLSLRIKVQNMIIMAGFLVLWKILFSVVGLYGSMRLTRRIVEIRNIIIATIFGTSILMILSIVFKIEMITNRFILIFFVVSSSITIFSRLIFRFVLTRTRLQNRNLRYMLIIGTNTRAIEIAKRIESEPKLGYRILGFVDEEWSGGADFSTTGYNIVAGFENVKDYIRDNIVDEVLIALPLKSYYQRAAYVAQFAGEQGIIVRYVSDIFKLNVPAPIKNQFVGDSITLQYSGIADGWQPIFKRMIDIIISVVLLVFLLPLLLIVAFLIKVTSPGPVWFIQDRVGLNKRNFRLFKFRSMHTGAEEKQSELESLNEASGPVFKIKDDPRVSSIGKILRRTSIDELPQLINVLVGDMSLVGPRPLPIRDYNGFETDWQRRRFSVRPGITCLWQVNGRSNLQFDQWMELDLAYIDQWSLWLDIKILIMTIPAVIRGSGAV